MKKKYFIYLTPLILIALYYLLKGKNNFVSLKANQVKELFTENKIAPENDTSRTGASPLNEWRDVYTGTEMLKALEENPLEFYRTAIRSHESAYSRVIRASLLNKTSIEEELNKAAIQMRKDLGK